MKKSEFDNPMYKISLATSDQYPKEERIKGIRNCLRDIGETLSQEDVSEIINVLHEKLIQ